MKRLYQALRSNRGSQSVGLIWVAPVFAMMIAVLYFAGTVTMGSNVVQSAANAGAREASLSRNAVEARSNARAAVNRVLDQRHLNCSERSVQVDAGALNNSLGTPGSVEVKVSCDLALVNFGFDNLTRKNVSAEGRSPVDMYRQR